MANNKLNIDAVLGILNDLLPDVESEIKTVVKNNDTILQGIMLRKKECNLGKIFYTEEYDNAIDERQVAERIAEEYQKDKPESISTIINEANFDYEKLKNKLFLRLVNLKMNTRYLEDIPYKEFLDLAVVIGISYSENDFYVTSSNVTKTLLELWGKTFDDVYIQARYNFEKLNKTVITDMNDIVNCYTPGFLYILSNPAKINGASRMLDTKALYDFSLQMDSDLIILPSSIHEVLLVPEKICGDDYLSDLNKIIQGVNESEVLSEEVLSDHFYRFSRDSSKIYF